MIVRVGRLARKLRGRSVDEVRVRGTQVVSSLLERAGLAGGARAYDDRRALRFAAGAPRDDAALLARWRERSGRAMPAAGLTDREGTLAALRRFTPGDEAATIARADRILDGRFDLLGYAQLDFGTPIDWHRDPVHDVRAPLRHWSRIDFLDPRVVGDHKVTWELNRHQYFVTLGQAWWYTGDERYARAFADHVAAWLDANPPKQGVNWASSLEVAYRAIAWLWGACLLRDADALTPALWGRIVAALDVHGRHLARYLSTYFSPNTHLTGEALGLVYLGTLLPELADAARWRAVGRAVLLDQVGKQVRPDGVYFEQATQYHRYTCEIFLHFHLLSRAAGDHEAAEAVREPLGRLYRHLAHAMRPDGTIPLVGDDDGGRLVQLDGRPARDVRGALAVGGAVLGDHNLAHAARRGDDEGWLAPLLWHLGPTDGLARLDGLPHASDPSTSHHFADGGYVAMRDGWGERAAWAFLDCGPHGTMNCGHAHADALSLELAVDGRPVLVDAGTFTYPGGDRNAFRTGAAHNTVTVDGAPSSEPGPTPFVWRSVAGCRALQWVASDAFDLFEGATDGFARLDPSLVHRRAVLFVKGDAEAPPYWLVRDRVAGERAHAIAVHWRAAPGYSARAAGTSVHLDGSAPGQGPVALHVLAGAGAWRVEPGWVSFAYGSRLEADVSTWSADARTQHDVVTFVAPAPSGSAPTVRELGATGGRAFELAGAWGRDLILVAADGSGDVRCDAVATDAAWAVVRWPVDRATPRRLVSVGGTYVRVDDVHLS